MEDKVGGGATLDWKEVGGKALTLGYDDYCRRSPVGTVLAQTLGWHGTCHAGC